MCCGNSGFGGNCCWIIILILILCCCCGGSGFSGNTGGCVNCCGSTEGWFCAGANSAGGA